MMGANGTRHHRESNCQTRNPPLTTRKIPWETPLLAAETNRRRVRLDDCA